MENNDTMVFRFDFEAMGFNINSGIARRCGRRDIRIDSAMLKLPRYLTRVEFHAASLEHQRQILDRVCPRILRLFPKNNGNEFTNRLKYIWYNTLDRIGRFMSSQKLEHTHKGILISLTYGLFTDFIYGEFDAQKESYDFSAADFLTAINEDYSKVRTIHDAIDQLRVCSLATMETFQKGKEVGKDLETASTPWGEMIKYTLAVTKNRSAHPAAVILLEYLKSTHLTFLTKAKKVKETMYATVEDFKGLCMEVDTMIVLPKIDGQLSISEEEAKAEIKKRVQLFMEKNAKHMAYLSTVIPTTDA